VIFKGIKQRFGISLFIATLLLNSDLSTAAGTLTVSVKTTDGSSLPNSQVSVVYLTGNGSDKMPSRHSSTPEMAQQNLQFSPYVKVVQRNVDVTFPNKDDVAHHVYSFSKKNAFELPLYFDQKIPSRAFSNTGQVSLGCNIHDWMLGFVLVVDTPLHAQFDGQAAIIDDIPSGTYTLHFWHPGMDRRENITKSIIIAENSQAQTIQLQYQVKALPQPQAPEEQFDDASDY
jgi:plastocyanin